MKNNRSGRNKPVIATVHIIAQKYVVGLQDRTTNLEQSQQVIELAVDIATNGGR
jgi:hypothetical protein